MTNNGKEFLRGFLENMSKIYSASNHVINIKQSTIWQHFLEKGEFFEGRQQYLSIAKERMAKTKECYYNSQLFALDNESEGIKYYEGYAYPEGLIPVEHGWCVKDGKVIDLTFDALDDMFKQNRKVTYFGIEIPNEVVRNSIITTKIARSLMWDDVFFAEAQLDII